MNPLQQARLSTRRVRMALAALAVVLVALHVSIVTAVTGEVDERLVAIDAAFALVLLLVAGWYVGRLRRERERAAIEAMLLDLLATPRSIQETATETLRLLSEHRLGDASVVAVVGEGDGPLRPLAATGYPRNWLGHAPAIALDALDAASTWGREPAPHHPWVEPVAAGLGKRPWVARIPLRSGADVVGLLFVSSRRPHELASAAIRLLLASRLGAAFDHAALYEAAYRRERDLEELETRRRTFMESISHEIRTPLNSIQAFADLLRLDEHSMDETAQQLVLSLNSGVDRLSALVNDLIDLGRTSSVELNVERREVDVAKILRDAEATVRPAVMLRKQEFTMDVPEGELRAIVDPRLLEQVVLNLLSNANRYTPPGGQIGVHAFAAPDAVRIEVRDSGPGIPIEERERIFEPYYRVRETERAVPGSGLGLAVARRLIDACGGRIWADESETGGARFCVEIRPAG